MEKQKRIAILIIALVVVIAGTIVAVTLLRSNPDPVPASADEQTFVAPPVKQETDVVEVEGGLSYIRPGGALQILSSEERGIFLYINSEARFFPDSVVQSLGSLSETVRDMPFYIAYDTENNKSVITFPSDGELPYEWVTLSEAMRDVPDVLVLAPEQK